jgi:hypothetical protein
MVSAELGGIVLALLASGVCAAPARTGSDDGLAMRLRLVVEVRSPEGQPSSNVTVRFLDTAPSPFERGLGRILGSTDKQGLLQTTFSHTWLDYFRADRRPDTGTFDIIVAENQVFHAAVECLPLEGRGRVLKLKVVARSDVIVLSKGHARTARPPNKELKLTKPGKLWSFAA